MIPIASLALLISAASPRTIPEEKEEGERSTILKCQYSEIFTPYID
jgi:hypothetical protein